MTVGPDDPYGYDAIARRVGDGTHPLEASPAQARAAAERERLVRSHEQTGHGGGNYIVAACFIVGYQVDSVDCPLCVEHAEATWRYSDGTPYRHGAVFCR